MFEKYVEFKENLKEVQVLQYNKGYVVFTV
ncbi:hypothetical protein ES705_38590 [subsurface metagenome]